MTQNFVAVRDAPAAERRLVIPPDALIDGRRTAELLVHALAQLPDIVTADIPVQIADVKQIDLLARAYGIRDRLHVSPAGARNRAPTSELPAELLRHRHTLGELVEGVSHIDDPPARTRRDDSVLRGHRIAIVTNFPSHYRLPLFAKMAARVSDVDGVLGVFFLAAEAGARPWLAADPEEDFYSEVLLSREIPLRERSPLFPVDLERRLADFAPTAILVGGFSPLVAGRVGLLARRRRTPWGVWSGETPRMGTARSWVRTRQRTMLLNRASFAIAYGAESADYLRGLQPDLPIVIGRNTAPLSVATQPPPLRQGVELLAVGDLTTDRKGVDVAIEALRSLPQLPCRLTVIGGGRLQPELQRRAGSDPRIRFLGPQPPERVRDELLSTDIVLFPTRADVFGLVVVEAMGAGVATVISKAAGAAADLADNEQNSLVIDGLELALWADALRRLVEDANLRRSLGEGARRTIERRWTLDHAADAMIAGLRLPLLGLKRR